MGNRKQLSGIAGPVPGKTRWLSPMCAIREREDGIVEVTIGGMLVGSYSKGERGARNLLLVMLAKSQNIELGKLAEAFRISGERLRQLCRLAEEKGLSAVVEQGRPGRSPISERIRRQLEELFAQGLNIDEAHAKIRQRVSRASVGRVHKRWADQQRQRSTLSEPEQVELPLCVDASTKKPPDSSERGSGITVVRTAMQCSPDTTLDAALVPRGGALVQHVGTWVMLGMLHCAGVYQAADDRNTTVVPTKLRLALDATASALSLGQGCVEGVRRLATPSAPVLLRATRAPSANWVRDTLHEFAPTGAVLFHGDCALRRLRQLARTAGGNVFYVDNHLRRYTGKHTIRKGWRMQDKRAVAGTTDYYVHDHKGRPVLRISCPGHDSLPRVLRPIGRFLRQHFEIRGKRITLVFDRGASFPEELAGLRDEDFDFVTYERRPYSQYPASCFQRRLRHRGERIAWYEAPQCNLGKQRGRIRRIALRVPDGAQVNVVAISTESAPRLVRKLLLRWGRQENQLKHAVERWGVNQLDGRKVEQYPPTAVIPNPARRRLDRALKRARDEEGQALRLLSHVESPPDARKRFEQQADQAYRRQCELEQLRATTPTHAEVRATSLAGKLQRHPGKYKLVIDTLRVALATAEDELAKDLGAILPKSREAKKTLHNLFTAPGLVRLRRGVIDVRLSVAATAPERAALNRFLRGVNRRRLTLPGDRLGRRLRFQIPNS